MKLNSFKIKLLIILECIILAVVIIIVCSQTTSVFTPVKNNEEPREVTSDDINAEQDNDLTGPGTGTDDLAPADNGYIAEQKDTQDLINTTEDVLLQYRVTRNGALGIDYPMVSDYGPRESLIEGMSTDHKGIDFSMDVGTELVAPYDVTVAHAGYNEYRGNWVVMYWKDGFYILYQHMAELDVWEGEHLSAGDRVGFSGETGVSVIPHLHLEVLRSYDGQDSVFDFEDKQLRINPYYFIFDNDSYESIW